MSTIKMGSEESKEESEEEELCMVCPHCNEKGVVATYRCRMVLETMGEIHKYPTLLKYWKPPFMMEEGMYYISYVACDACIEDEDIPMFTHYSDGWLLHSNSKAMYELAKLK